MPLHCMPPHSMPTAPIPFHSMSTHPSHVSAPPQPTHIAQSHPIHSNLTSSSKYHPALVSGGGLFRIMHMRLVCASYCLVSLHLA